MDKNKNKKLIGILIIVAIATVGFVWKGTQKVESILAVVSEKRDFKVNEDTEFKFKYLKAEVSSTKLIEEIVNPSAYWEEVDIEAELEDSKGNYVHISPEISLENNGEFSVKFKKPQMFRPGVYKMKMKIEDKSGESVKVKEIEQEFTWGVLAINVNKSIYLSGEEAYIQMAALREDGHTICDARLELRIKNNELGINEVLSTEDGMIQYSGECGDDNVTDVPDYFAYYRVGEVGNYQLKLINLDAGYEIRDSFEVRESVPFDVERIGPTRIYPPATYEMVMKIKANQDFEGEVIETVPERFEILNRGSASISSEGGTKIISWQVVWKAGETYELSYQFDAPDVSPYLYLLGPLEFYE